MAARCLRGIGECRRHHWRAAEVHAGGQCQWQRLRQLHLPGAGQRRHGQWRGGSRPEPEHDHGQCHAGERRAERDRQDGQHHRGHGLHLYGGRLRLQRCDRQPGQCAAGGEDHDAAGGRDADRQWQRGDLRGIGECRRHHWRAAEVHAGGQCQWQRLRQLHLPGAGQRRHGQWRRGSRPEPEHDHGQRHPGERCAERDRQDGQHHRGHGLHLYGG